MFALNADGESLDDALYTLLLGEATAELYLIATNTTDGENESHNHNSQWCGDRDRGELAGNGSRISFSLALVGTRTRMGYGVQ